MAKKPHSGAKPSRRKTKKTDPPPPFAIVGIGASAGGLESISVLLRNLRPDTGMAFVIVQHLGPHLQSNLPILLEKTTAMPVVEVRDHLSVEPNHVYVLTPNYDVILEKRRLRLLRRPKSERLHMPIDHFLQSLATEEQDRAIGVVLSGTGSDGTLGLRAIKSNHGLTFAEAEATAKYFDMPNSAILAGCVDHVRPPKLLARDLGSIAKHPYVKQPISHDGAAGGFPAGADALTKVFFLLKQHTSVNFADYKHTTLRRRIARRMVLQQVETLGDYVKFLRNRPEELDQLFNDLLINVTGFFRDAGAFAALQNKILPRIIKSKPLRGELRVWVPGCATGEEVYSVAIAVVEALGRSHSPMRVQIFGTDLSEQIVARARAGIYPESIVKDISAARRRRFFTKTANGSYQISRSIRDMCTFARQNVCEDPPFSHIDLITCRNVLIYLGPTLQRKCIPIFHYALNSLGYLMLGASETVGGFADLFSLVDKKSKIYLKKAGGLRPALDFNSKNFGSINLEPPSLAPAVVEDRDGGDLQKQVDRLILTRYSPSGIVADERLQVLQFRGATSRYLEHGPGAASLNLLQMAKAALVVDLRSALHRAMKENSVVRRENILVAEKNEARLIHLEVAPLRVGSNAERLFFVTFEDAGAAPFVNDKPLSKTSIATSQSHRRKLEFERLHSELNSTKESLQAIIEEREAANEELKSANEEIQSSNEELQSTNEELETAKEELQSANEELTTVNEELAVRNAELAVVNSDLHNLLSSINIPIIIVDNDLRVRRVTAPGEKTFNLIPSDVGRPLVNIKPNLETPDLGPLIRDVIDTLSTREREVRDNQGRWHQLRIRPYRTTDNKIDGAVITLVDIDHMKRAMSELQNVIEFANKLLDAARDPTLILDDKLQVRQANRAFRERFRIPKAAIEGARVHKLGDRWSIPGLRPWLGRLLSGKRRKEELQLAHTFPLLGELYLTFHAQRLKFNGEQLVVLTMRENDGAQKKA